MLLGEYVETNPGPPRQQRQRSIAFAETTTPPPRDTRSVNPRTSRRNRQNGQSEQQYDIMIFLQDMKADLRTDLASKNSKLNGMNSSIESVRSENESIRNENNVRRQESIKLSGTVDRIEGQSRQNNLRFYGIPGRFTKHGLRRMYLIVLVYFRCKQICV